MFPSYLFPFWRKIEFYRNKTKDYTFSVRSFGSALFYFREVKMVRVAFCGHAQYTPTQEHEEQILNYLQMKVGDEEAELLLGGYGAFDEFAFICCKKYKETHPFVDLIYVTPYLYFKPLDERNEYLKSKYDKIIYPGLETTPKRYAIVERNKYMVLC